METACSSSPDLSTHWRAVYGGLPDRVDRKPVETGWIQIQFKIACVIGLDRYTGQFDRFTCRFDRFEFKSKFKIACVTGLERYTGRFDRFTKWDLMGRLIFFFFWFNFKCPKNMLNERIFEKIWHH